MSAMAEIVVHGLAGSPYTQMVAILLEEKRVAWRP